MPIKMPCKLCKNALGYGLFRELQTRCLIFNFANDALARDWTCWYHTIVFVYCPIKEKIQLLTGSRDIYILRIQLFFFAWKSTAFLWCTCSKCKEERGQVFDIFMTWLFNKWQKPTNIFIKCFFFFPSHTYV